MANYATLKAAISQVIKENGNKEITGAVMQTTLLAMVDSMASGYTFAGVATPSTSAGTPDENVFWIGGAGSYSNFGATTINVPTGCICIFTYNGSFASSILYVGGVVDISKLTNTSYASLSLALADVPSFLQVGGLEVMYQDSTSGNYVKYRLMTTSWSATETNWQGVDESPTENSKNLVESGGAFLFAGKARNYVGITENINKSIKSNSNDLFSFVATKGTEYAVELTFNDSLQANCSFTFLDENYQVRYSETIPAGTTQKVVKFISIKEEKVIINFYNNSSSNVSSIQIKLTASILCPSVLQSQNNAIFYQVKDASIPYETGNFYIHKDTGRQVYINSLYSHTPLIRCYKGDVFSYKGRGRNNAASVVFYSLSGQFLSSELYDTPNDKEEIEITADGYVMFVSETSNGANILEVKLENSLKEEVEQLSLEIGGQGTETTLLNDTVSLHSGDNNVFEFNVRKGCSYNVEITLNTEVTNASWLSIIDSSNNQLAGHQVNIGTLSDSVSYNATDNYNASKVFFYNSSSSVTSVQILVTETRNVKSSINNPIFGKKLSLDGDSICYGAGYLGGYGNIIASRNLMSVQNIGVAGGTITAETSASHWICRTIDNLDSDADYILIEGGVNDASLGVPLGTITNGYNDTLDDETYYGALESIMKTLCTKFAGKKYGFVIVHQMTNNYRWSNDEATSYYWAIVKCCKKWGVPFCDLNVSVPPFNYFRNNAALDAVRTTYTKDGDGWHPNKDGYEKYYCDKIEEWMKTL